MRYFSTFSGIGGFELGIIQAYENNSGRSSREGNDGEDIFGQRDCTNGPSQRNRGQSLVCVGFSEIDKYATQVYQKQFPTHKNYGDITKIAADSLPDFDLLVGGFPCQSFSIAGKRRGFEDTRGTLFFDLARILRAKRPRLFVFENVKGLLSHDGGKTFSTIVATLDELGYDVQWEVLNSKDHGVPQNRERVYIVGHLRGTPRPQVFPIGRDSEEADELPRHIANTLTARYYGAQAVGTYVGESELDAQAIRVPEATKQGYALAPTMTSKGYQDNNHVGGVRRLTPTECERLQGFPDGWTAEGAAIDWRGWEDTDSGKKKVKGHFLAGPTSDTQRYKMLGNAVTVNVVRAVMERLLINK